MHALIAFFGLLFAPSHPAPAAPDAFVAPDTHFSQSETTPSRDEMARVRDRSVYAGTACTSCRRTNVISIAR